MHVVVILYVKNYVLPKVLHYWISPTPWTRQCVHTCIYLKGVYTLAYIATCLGPFLVPVDRPGYPCNVKVAAFPKAYLSTLYLEDLWNNTFTKKLKTKPKPSKVHDTRGKNTLPLAHHFITCAANHPKHKRDYKMFIVTVIVLNTTCNCNISSNKCYMYVSILVFFTVEIYRRVLTYINIDCRDKQNFLTSVYINWDQ